MKIVIVGSGVVGSSTGKAIIENTHHEVLFTDVDKNTVFMLREEGFRARNIDDVDWIGEEADIIMVCVPTPNENGVFVTKYIEDATEQIAQGLKDSHRFFVILFRSTVFPGVTQQILVPIVEKYLGKVGERWGAAFQPEYLREWAMTEDAKHPRLIVFGVTDKKTEELCLKIYSWVKTPVKIGTIISAEFQKLAHNAFNATKISFFNEVRIAAQQLGINDDEVIGWMLETAEGLWNTKYGTKPMGAFDGSCLPKDMRTWLELMRTLQLPTNMAEGVIEINELAKKKPEIKKTDSRLENYKDEKRLYSTTENLGFADKVDHLQPSKIETGEDEENLDPYS